MRLLFLDAGPLAACSHLAVSLRMAAAVGLRLVVSASLVLVRSYRSWILQPFSDPQLASASRGSLDGRALPKWQTMLCRSCSSRKQQRTYSAPPGRNATPVGRPPSIPPFLPFGQA